MNDFYGRKTFKLKSSLGIFLFLDKFKIITFKTKTINI